MTVVNIQVARTCNLRCSFCSHDRWTEATGMMDFALFERIVASLKADGIGTVCFVSAQGESLLHPRIFDMLEAALAAGFETNLVTNGTPLNERRIERLAALGLDAVQFSFAGWDKASYEAAYVGGRFEPVSRNLAGLIHALRGTRTMLTINGVLRDECGIEPTRAYLASLGAAPETIRLGLAHNWGGTVEAGRQRSVPAGTVWSHRDLAGATRKVCPLLLSTQGIYIDGRVTACGCIDANGALEIGHIGDGTISSMRGGERYRGMVKAFEQGDVSGLPLCAGCEIPYS